VSRACLHLSANLLHLHLIDAPRYPSHNILFVNMLHKYFCVFFFREKPGLPTISGNIAMDPTGGVTLSFHNLRYEVQQKLDDVPICGKKAMKEILCSIRYE